MVDQDEQRCGNCGHFNMENPTCGAIVEEGKPVSRTTYEPKTFGVSGFEGHETYSEAWADPSPDDPCHFSDGSRWIPRIEDQGPDPI